MEHLKGWIEEVRKMEAAVVKAAEGEEAAIGVPGGEETEG